VFCGKDILSADSKRNKHRMQNSHLGAIHNLRMETSLPTFVALANIHTLTHTYTHTNFLVGHKSREKYFLLSSSINEHTQKLISKAKQTILKLKLIKPILTTFFTEILFYRSIEDSRSTSLPKMCRPGVTWYACGCEDTTVKLETCDYHKALKTLIEDGAQHGDDRVVENRENCFKVMDQGRNVVFKKRHCDKCQHIYTEETYGTECQESSMKGKEVIRDSASVSVGKSNEQA